MKPGYKQTEVGVIPEDWSCKKIGCIASVHMCKRIFANQTSAEADIPFYKIGTFGKEADTYIATSLYEEYKSKFSYPQKGDILISAAGTLGKTVIFDGRKAYFQDSNIVWLDIDKKRYVMPISISTIGLFDGRPLKEVLSRVYIMALFIIPISYFRRCQNKIKLPKPYRM